MICYRGMTFCADYIDCANKECVRHWNEDHQQKAIQWWGQYNPPVAFGSFKDTCGMFKDKSSS